MSTAPMKIIRQSLLQCLRAAFVVAFISAWMFSAWPQILNFPFPVENAQASVVVASSIADSAASGNPNQSHLIYAVNSAQWWLFYVDQNSNTVLRTAYSNDLVTWTSGIRSA